MPDEKLIQQCYEEFKSNLLYYQKMQQYYQGNSDVVIEKSDIDTTSTSKIKNNFLKKFIKEEVDYILGNDVTFVNLQSDQNLEEVVNYHFSHWKKDHDKKLFRRALLFLTPQFVTGSGHFCHNGWRQKTRDFPDNGLISSVQ